MRVTIGIDIGGSQTKIVGLRDKKRLSPFLVKANDPIASLYGAFGKFLLEQKIRMEDVDSVFMTGVGASYVERPIFGLPTAKVTEFMAIGLGGQYISSLERAIVVSMGTGTAIIKADGDAISHIGGSGVGGGTLVGLSERMLNIRDMDSLIRLAQKGDLSKVDLLVNDLSQHEIPGLPPDTTASNFGKIDDMAAASDLALGIFNMVFQTIGVIASFASKAYEIEDVVLIGNVAKIDHAKRIMERLSQLYGIRIVIPEHAEYAVAYGAALADKNREYVEQLFDTNQS